MSRSFTRIALLLPRMTDAEVAFYDPAGRGVAWSQRLFGEVGNEPFEAVAEGQFLLVGRSPEVLIEATLRSWGRFWAVDSMTAGVTDTRLTDEIVEDMEDRLRCFDVLELALRDDDIDRIERTISVLPFVAYRIERNRTECLFEAQFLDFDWLPEIGWAWPSGGGGGLIGQTVSEP